MKNTYDLILEDTKNFKDYFLNNEDLPIKYLPKFNSINIIVGANNSGKSRFMRNLMNIKSTIGIYDLNLLQELISEYNEHIEIFNKDVLSDFIKKSMQKFS